MHDTQDPQPGPALRLPSQLLHATLARPVRRERPRVPEARFRTVWISDLHLGTRGARAEELLAFLGACEFDTLYLVGDVIDGWKLAREPYWPESHQAVLDTIRARARAGARVVYVTGNHDEELRALEARRFERIRCVDQTVHETLDGRRLLVLHGDLFDGVLNGFPRLAELGDRAYEVAVAFDRGLNRVLSCAGSPSLPVSRLMKQGTKAVVARANRWVDRLLGAARGIDAHGVVCGHNHVPELLERRGMLYLNDGDWVESCTALVERLDGALELVGWDRGQLLLVDALEHRPRVAARGVA